MTAQMPERVRGLDGRSYPSRHLTHDDLAHVIGRVHFLAHDEDLSVRQIVARLAGEGITRSAGSVSEYLSRNRCDGCSGASSESPERQHVSWRRAAEPERSGDQDRPPEQLDYSDLVGQLITEHRQLRGRRPAAHMLAVTIASITDEANFYLADDFAALDDGSITPELADELAAAAEHVAEVAEYLRHREGRR